MQVNPLRSYWAQEEVEYLGFIITRDGLRPQPKKIKAILDMDRSKTQKDIHRFVGMVNYYKSMFPKCSTILDPLTKLIGKGVIFQWTDIEQQAFDHIKVVLSKDILLAHPNFKDPFIIHTNASDLQISGVISQNERPIVFFSCKFSAAQRKYLVTEQDLLAIAETLKEFQKNLLGHKIIVYTDHKNLTYKSLTHFSNQVLCQRLILEEYGVNLCYVKGEENCVVDTLSRHPTRANSLATSTLECYLNQRVYEDDVPFPLDLQRIKELQESDKHLKQICRQSTRRNMFKKQEMNGIELWTMKEDRKIKIYIPQEAQEDLI